MTVTLNQLRCEFDRWAETGLGAEMETAHHVLADIVISLMSLRPDSRVLDLGCGTGWATRLLGQWVPKGRAVGLDVSDAMIRQARRAYINAPQVAFRVLREPRFPFPDGAFTHCVSIESLYYHPDVAATFREIYRVLAPGGSAFMVISFFKENPHTHHWAQLLDIPVHLLSGDEYAGYGRAAGFRCRQSTIREPNPVTTEFVEKHYTSPEAFRAGRAIGSLLIVAEKNS